jgi:hypothetical protein
MLKPFPHTRKGYSYIQYHASLLGRNSRLYKHDDCVLMFYCVTTVRKFSPLHTKHVALDTQLYYFFLTTLSVVILVMQGEDRVNLVFQE